MRWNDVPRGTMDEVSSHVRLNLPFVRRQGRGNDCSTSSSDPMMERPGADSEEKREPVGDIDIAVVDSLKVLTPDGRLEKHTWPQWGKIDAFDPTATFGMGHETSQLACELPCSISPLGCHHRSWTF